MKDVPEHAKRYFEVDESGRKIFFGGMKGDERHQLRLDLYAQQEGKCWWCKREMLLVDFKQNYRKISNNHDTVATFEHLQDDWAIPYGKDHRTLNIRLACARCNANRAHSRLRIFMEYLKKELDVDREELHRYIRSKKPREMYPAFTKYRDELIELLNGVYFGPMA